MSNVQPPISEPGNAARASELSVALVPIDRLPGIEGGARPVREVQPGDVVQLDPQFHLGDANGFFAGCFMIVDEVKAWGVQGHILIPEGPRGYYPNVAYYRANWDEMRIVGPASWRAQLR